MRACIHDPFSPCDEDCPDCPRSHYNEPDPDQLFEEWRDREREERE